MRAGVATTRVTRRTPHESLDRPDLLAVEEPLEIRLGYGKGAERKQQSVAVTMRTPGNDFELAAGFLFTEGILHHNHQVGHIRYCEDIDHPEAKDNIVRIELNESEEVDSAKFTRNFYTTSSCGVCGKASIESIEQNCQALAPGPEIDVNVFFGLGEKLREEQAVFEHTGGLHAAALFSAEGEFLHLREDVGRHNALDKLIGAQFLTEKLPLSQSVLLLSGRISFELVQKAVMAGIPVVCAVGAPSSLAVQTANKFGMTLIGFLKPDKLNIYSDFNRIKG